MTLEWALRAVALVSLALLLWRALRPPADGATARTLRPRLTTLATVRDSARVGDTLALEIAGALPAVERDALSALVAAGRVVRWHDAGVPAIAAMVDAPRMPDGVPRLVALAAENAPVVLGDAGGTLDSMRVTAGGGVVLAVPGAGRALAARVGGATARASLRESLAVRRVLVLGRAGWEAKFTIAALEEAGWIVDAALDVAPATRVTQGEGRVTLAPDTARHAAVVVLDSATAAARGAGLLRYVRAGGGLVLAGDAAAAASVAELRAGKAGARAAGEAGALAASQPRRGLPLRAVAAAGDAIVLERRGALVAAAARRVGTGRVLQLGYEDTWRWRMEGDDTAPAAHRRWWSAVVGSVAYAPVVARLAPSADDTTTLDPAPRAALVAALGAPQLGVAPAAPPARSSPWPDSFLFAAAVAALLLEWSSRRLRGAR